MGWLPSLPPAYFCALNIDTLSRGTAPRPPKALRCSANITRAIRARTQGALFAGNEYALFLANCPLHTCRAVACPRRCLPLNRCRFAAFCLALVDGFDLFPSGVLFAQLVLFVAFGLLPRCERLCPSRSPPPFRERVDGKLDSRTALCFRYASSAAQHSPMHANNYEL